MAHQGSDQRCCTVGSFLNIFPRPAVCRLVCVSWRKTRSKPTCPANPVAFLPQTLASSLCPKTCTPLCWFVSQCVALNPWLGVASPLAPTRHPMTLSAGAGRIGETDKARKARKRHLKSFSESRQRSTVINHHRGRNSTPSWKISRS